MIKTLYLLGLSSLVLLTACSRETPQVGNQPLRVVTTTTMITDLVKELGDTAVQVNGLMGAGVDPHLYKASEGDVMELAQADLLLYNGLHLEGKLEDVFEKMQQRGVTVEALAEAVPEQKRIRSAAFASNYDPHIWFDIDLWRKAAEAATEALVQKNPEQGSYFQANLLHYLVELDSTEALVRKELSVLPDSQRVLITAHDAFRYFGKAYNFEVRGLQGISTATEAGVRDVQELADFIVKRQIKAIFVESSVSQRNIEALQAAVRSKGFEVKIGGELFSDACGDAGTPEETYIGMLLHNIRTIVKALK